VLSLPDGLARALAEYLGATPDTAHMETGALATPQLPMAVGDLCPECGCATLVAEEGCRKCYTCGYSEC